ncbi:peroxiredoxin family protein [uncultured Flavobacterium sp.]|uniref:peroxiredoxin family protein n=1 Tax=uncultured Flavobacterium sp. TaxID=165435 RepID=UPI0030CA28F4
MRKIMILVLFSLALNTQAQIANSPQEVCPLLIGEKIPNITLTNIDEQEVSTKEIFNKKTVLIIYRGGWCPYCNSQLSDLQDIEKEILDLGFQIIAVSPDSPKFLNETIEKDKLNYTLYSDSKGLFSQTIGIAYKKDKPKLNKYSEGKNPGFLPVPTVYVLNEKQEIEFMYINPNYSTRLKGKLLLVVLKNL